MMHFHLSKQGIIESTEEREYSDSKPAELTLEGNKFCFQMADVLIKLMGQASDSLWMGSIYISI